MIERLENTEKRFVDLEQEMALSEVASNPQRMLQLAQERAILEPIVTKYRAYKNTLNELESTKSLLRDSLGEDFEIMVKDEIRNLEHKAADELRELKLALLPRDPNDARDTIIEIRAGIGGEEASLFAANLYQMYVRYAQIKGWSVDIIDINATDLGGIREVVFEVKGKGAYSRLKYERGVHRVQRIPNTEASGRVHTSTATVAVLPEASDIEVDIKPDDLRIDIFHSSGAGGQNVNKVATAVRITHLPTGMVVVCQDERSQLRNRTKAMTVLRARLLDMERQKQEESIDSERRLQIGTGERSEKIRTYNFPQDRVTDHRIGLTLHNLPRIMSGELDELIDAIATYEQAKLLESSFK